LLFPFDRGLCLAAGRNFVSFDNTLLLHGKGGSPEGSVKDIEALLRNHYPQKHVSSFQRPRLLHADGEILAEQSLAELQKRDIPKSTVVIGISLGGLLAAKLQEQGREDLRVICLNSPTWADAVRLERRMPERLAFYSSNDNVIAGRTEHWPRLATAFDLPWLTHDTSAHAPELTPLIIAYLEGRNVAHAIQQVEERIAQAERHQRDRAGAS
jgi:pimeloyl-ACP methyl ester carboxylesterase